MDISDVLNSINRYVLNPIIIFFFALATLILFWGIFQFIASETADNKREEGKKKIIWGVVGIFIMFSAYGLISLILDTFGLNGPQYLPL